MRSFLRLLSASFLMGLRAGFWRIPGFESAALDHETVDDAVKHGIGVEARLHVVEKILHRLRRASGVEFERDDAEVGFEV